MQPSALVGMCCFMFHDTETNMILDILLERQNVCLNTAPLVCGL